MEEPDIVECPDSDKPGVMVGSPPGGERSTRRLTLCFPRTSAADYREGEEQDPPSAEGGANHSSSAAWRRRSRNQPSAFPRLRALQAK